MASPSPRRSLRPAPSAPTQPNTRTLLSNFTPARLVNILTRNVDPSARRRLTQISNLPKPSGRPNLVVKWGPPASGKGSAGVRAAIEKLGDGYNTYFHLNIDAIIEETNWFKRSSRLRAEATLAAAAGRLGNGSFKMNNANSISQLLNKISEANAKKLGGPYKWLRENFPLSGPPSRGRPHRTPSNAQDALLEEALLIGRNVTIETTGSGGGNGWPGWIFSKLRQDGIAQRNYRVVFVFPLVPFGVAWRRYKSRAIGSYMSGGGFRFASTRGQLKATYKAAYQNFRSILANPDQFNKIDRIMLIHPYQRNANLNFTLGKNAPYRTAAQRGSARKFITKFIEDVDANSRTNLNANLKQGLGPSNNGLPSLRPLQTR